jgi:hypothetical protein
MHEIRMLLLAKHYPATQLIGHMTIAHTVLEDICNKPILRCCQTARSMRERDGRFVARDTVN